MKLKKPRPYSMTNRADSTAQTSKTILIALADLWLEYSIHEITLDRIAVKSGITTRTILRKYGSKEGLFEAAMLEDVTGIKSIKEEAQIGNIPQIVSTIMKEYEATGKAAIRTLAAENELPIAGKILQHARQMHTTWCARVFEPFLPLKVDANYPILLGAFYAATDVNKWKLLRLDLGFSVTETESIFITTLQGLSTLKTTSI
jgi:AcrR family transcriptional regulator